MSLILGIDLGTTSVKVAVVDSDTHEVVDIQSEATNADIVSDTSSLGHEQSYAKIFNAFVVCLQRVETELRRKVTRIAVSGQMHGVVLWKSNVVTDLTSDDLLQITCPSKAVSPLFTWQDGRCTNEFLASLPEPNSHLHLATGHGCATLFWLMRNNPAFFKAEDESDRFDCAGTIMDLLTALLCGIQKPLMSVQNAASWGFYDTVSNSWNEKILKQADFAVNLLPEVGLAGSKIGELRASWLGIQRGAGIGVAMGDLQCSILPHLTSDTQAVINVGTSMQAVVKCPPAFTPSRSTIASSLAYFPFFKGTYITVAASLNGGNVLTAMVKMMQETMAALGIPEEYVEEEKIFDVLMEKGNCVKDTDLVINPTIHGERHAMDKKGSARNITPFNINIGHFSRALCRGLMENLVDMLPKETVRTAGVTKIVGCGNALLRNKILQEELERAYGMPVMPATNNAAVGAAIALAKFWQ